MALQETEKKSRRRRVLRGDVFYADLDPVAGCEQGGQRPVLILQNDLGNRYGPTTIVAPITSHLREEKLPTQVKIPAGRCRFERDSVVLLEQIRTVDKCRLQRKLTRLDKGLMERVRDALEISLGLTSF
ncbi:MAG: type II toxin-antitoxin system PemK/MazF family toxin [Bacillota bacterium]|nr:type II toxin-antitoxin system PemK/MazF family toxin [Bacillota bacterium]